MYSVFREVWLVFSLCNELLDEPLIVVGFPEKKKKERRDYSTRVVVSSLNGSSFPLLFEETQNCDTCLYLPAFMWHLTLLFNQKIKITKRLKEIYQICVIWHFFSIKRKKAPKGGKKFTRFFFNAWILDFFSRGSIFIFFQGDMSTSYSNFLICLWSIQSIFNCFRMFLTRRLFQ